ncbi:MAG: GNAT family N-acetyltransferase [Bacteroidota bacterium]
MKRNFIFREAQHPSERELLMNVQKQIFQKSRLSSLVDNQASSLKLDQIKERHFGLFTVDEEVIGSVQLLFASCPANSRYLPSCHYVEHESPLSYFLRELPSSMRIVEGTRLALKPEFRGLSIVRWILEVLIMISFWVERSDWAIISCTPSHQRFYEKYGFEALDPNHIISYKQVRGVQLLRSSTHQLPKSVEKRFQQMLNFYHTCGEIPYLT